MSSFRAEVVKMKLRATTFSGFNTKVFDHDSS